MRFWGEHPALSQLRPQRQQHIKHHPHPGNRLALKLATRLAWVDDHIGIRQNHLAIDDGGQVVIRHQHLQTQGTCRGHAFHAGDAVVHGDEHIGRAVFDALGNRRGQAVTIDHPVWHDVSDVLGAQQAQSSNAHRTGGGPVAVVIGDDAELFICGDCVSQQHGRFCRSLHRGGRQQQSQAVVQFGFSNHPARRVQLRQQRVHARLFERPHGSGRDVTSYYFHSCLRLSVKRFRPKTPLKWAEI